MTAAGTAGRADSPARMYAKVVGIVVLVVGIVGLIAGNPEDGLLGLFNIDIVEDIIHLGSGGLLAYVGFKASNSTVKSVVTAIGVIYLIVGVVGFVLPKLFGLIPNGYSVADNILHLTLGALALFAALGNAAKEGTSTRHA